MPVVVIAVLGEDLSGTVCRSKIRFGAVSCGEAVRSCASLVLVDQASEEALTPDPVGVEVGDGGRGGRGGRGGGFGAVRGRLLPGLVGAVPVVVPEVFGQDCASVGLVVDMRSRSSRRRVPTALSRIAFALGACGGLSRISMSSALKTASKVRVYLVSRSRRRKRSDSIRRSCAVARFLAC
jgi:hypothetical protein